MSWSGLPYPRRWWIRDGGRWRQRMRRRPVIRRMGDGPVEAGAATRLLNLMRRSRPMDAQPPVAHARQEAAALGEACGAGDGDEELLLCDRRTGAATASASAPMLAAVPLGPWLCQRLRSSGPAPKPIISFPMKQRKINSFQIQIGGLRVKCGLSQGLLSGFRMKQKKIVDFFGIL